MQGKRGKRGIGPSGGAFFSSRPRRSPPALSHAPLRSHSFIFHFILLLNGGAFFIFFLVTRRRLGPRAPLRSHSPRLQAGEGPPAVPKARERLQAHAPLHSRIFLGVSVLVYCMTLYDYYYYMY